MRITVLLGQHPHSTSASLVPVATWVMPVFCAMGTEDGLWSLSAEPLNFVAVSKHELNEGWLQMIACP
jgi:hypothetical protein